MNFYIERYSRNIQVTKSEDNDYSINICVGTDEWPNKEFDLTKDEALELANAIIKHFEDKE